MRKTMLAAALAALAGLVGCSSTPTVPVVRIGHAAPLSGSIGHLGEDNRRGAQLAVEELNAKGVRIAGQAVRFELVNEDDRADRFAAPAAAQRLVSAKVVAVVGHLNSGTSIPASQVYGREGIPTISPSATNPKLTQQGLPQTFRLIVNEIAVGNALGRYAVNLLGARRVAIVDDGSAYGQGIAEAFESGASGAGAVVVDRHSTDGGPNFSRIVSALAARDPDLVFFGGLDTHAGPLLREMQAQGLRAQLMGGDGICTGELARRAGGFLPDNRVWCSEPGDLVRSSPEAEQFQIRFTERFKSEPILYAAHTYDAVQLFAKAMVDAGSTDPRVFTPVLAKTAGWRGAAGPVSFDAKGDLVDGPLTVFTYRGNVRTKVGVTR